MTTKYIIQWLKANAEPQYAKFSAALIPNLRHKIYGVRLPKLRQKAKELVGQGTDISPDSIEEILLQGYLIGQLSDLIVQLSEMRKFIKLIDNWATCDSFCSALHLAVKYPEKFFPDIKKYATSSHDYEQRFAYVMLLKYFCRPDYIKETLRILQSAKPRIWDTQQAVAWALAECFIKFPQETVPVLTKIPPELFKLTRRKICDSKRVDASVKQQLKSGNLSLLV